MRRSVTFWVVVTVSVSWLGWKIEQQFSTLRTESQRRKFVEAVEGDILCRPDGHKWGSSKGAFVIALAGGCRACEVAKSLDQRIEEYGRTHGIPTYFVVNSRKQDRALTQELRDAGQMVVEIDPLSFGVTMVPTFARVDDRGIIQAMWVGAGGKLQEEHEEEAFKLVTSGQSYRGYSTTSLGTLAVFARDSKYQVVSLAVGGHRPPSGVTLIPAHDFAVRAPQELDRDIAIVLDCQSAPSAVACQTAARTLVRAGFKTVLAAGLPNRPRECS